MAQRGDAVLSKLGLAALVLLVGAVGALAFVVTRPDPTPRFCTLALALVGTRDGIEVSLEDQGDPGEGECDGQDTSPGMVTYGLDCKVRDEDGEVIDEVEPNRDDGSCGWPDEGRDLPAAWGIEPY